MQLVVDGAQTAGITHIDLARTPVDAMAMSTQKGLCSGVRHGLSVRQEIAGADPAAAKPGAFRRDIPATHESRRTPGPSCSSKGARRFDLNYNFLGATLVKDSLDVLNGIGTAAIDSHVTQLAGTLATGLEAMGAPVHQPRPGRRSNIVCVQARSGPPAAAALQAHLKACNVQAALRRNTVRFSFHLYNDPTDVAAALEATEGWMRRHGASLG